MAVLQCLEAVDHEWRPPRLAHAELARTRDDPHVRGDRREAPEVLSPHALRRGDEPGRGEDIGLGAGVLIVKADLSGIVWGSSDIGDPLRKLSEGVFRRVKDA